MRVTNHETDAEKRVFVGYITALVAIALAVVRSGSVFTYGGTSLNEIVTLSFWDKVDLLSQGNVILGMTLLAAAFLLMLETEEESGFMKFSIVCIAILSVAVIFVSAVGITNQFLGDGLTDYISSTELQSAVETLSAGVLAVAAFALTWPVIKSLRLPDSVDIEDEVE